MKIAGLTIPLAGEFASTISDRGISRIFPQLVAKVLLLKSQNQLGRMLTGNPPVDRLSTRDRIAGFIDGQRSDGTARVGDKLAKTVASIVRRNRSADPR